MSNYAQKLKDPRWQRKRLEIMERDKFACQRCQSTENTLNVHHRTYRKGAEPWDYENENFVTLCEGCHQDAEYQKNMILSCLQWNSEMDEALKTLSLGSVNDPSIVEMASLLGKAVQKHDFCYMSKQVDPRSESVTSYGTGAIFAYSTLIALAAKAINQISEILSERSPK